VPRDPQIERENLGLLGQEIEGRVDPVDVATCAVLVAKKVQRNGEEATLAVVVVIQVFIAAALIDQQRLHMIPAKS